MLELLQLGIMQESLDPLVGSVPLPRPSFSAARIASACAVCVCFARRLSMLVFRQQSRHVRFVSSSTRPSIAPPVLFIADLLLLELPEALDGFTLETDLSDNTKFRLSNVKAGLQQHPKNVP